MMELHILGTASARPTSTRNVSGSVLSTEEGLVVIDAGEGFQIRYSFFLHDTLFLASINAEKKAEKEAWATYESEEASSALAEIGPHQICVDSFACGLLIG